MKPRTKKVVLIACAIVALAVVVWFAPGPIEGAYRRDRQDADGGCYFVYMSGGRARIYMPDDPPPLDAGEYKRTSRGWEWVSEPSKVVTVVEPHLLYMRCKQDNGFPSSLRFRELRFWQVRPVLADPKQQKVRQRKAANQSASGKGGIPSLFHAGRPRPALPERYRWASNL